MSIQQRISSTNIKSKNIFGEDEPNIFFNSNIKSVKIPHLYFTNFINNKKSPLVNTLKQERRRIIKKQVDYDNEYEIKNIEYRNNERKKISKILYDTIGIKIPDYSLLWRLKYIINPSIQYFFLDNLDGTYEIIIVDIYHLILPAPDKSHKEKKANPKKTYNAHSLANYCLSNIYK